jgi:Fe-S cluster assembly protein SufB
MAKDIISQITDTEYQYGFVSKIDVEEFPKGLNEEIIRLISKRKNEPEWLLEFRLDAFAKWQTMTEPDWAHLTYKKANYQEITYLAIPKNKNVDAEKGTVDVTLVDTFNKLGISLEEQHLSEVAVDAVIDSVSVKTTFSEQLEKEGIIFCSFGEAVHKCPELVKKYLGAVVPIGDNFFAALNSAVFSEGSFCYIPKGVRCPMELSTYFRINAAGTGQFERTLLIADEGA